MHTGGFLAGLWLLFAQWSGHCYYIKINGMAYHADCFIYFELFVSDEIMPVVEMTDYCHGNPTKTGAALCRLIFIS